MILKALVQPKARVYGALCWGSDTGTDTKWWHLTHAAYRADNDFYPVELTVLNEFKSVGNDFSRGISGWIWSISHTKFACCNFKLR